MNFGENEKKYIDFILEKKFVNIVDFLEYKFSTYKKGPVGYTILIEKINEQNYQIDGNDDVYLIEHNNIEMILSEIANFYSLCEYLNNNQCLNIINDIPSEKKQTFFIEVLVGNYSEINIINKLIIKYNSKRVFATPELKELKDNQYELRNDIQYKREQRQRIISERLTWTLAILSIVVSVVFSILTYNNCQKVIIMNEPIIKDPLSIELKNMDNIERILKERKEIIIEINNLNDLLMLLNKINNKQNENK